MVAAAVVVVVVAVLGVVVAAVAVVVAAAAAAAVAVAAAAAVPDTSPLLLPGNQVQQSITEHDEHHRNVCKYQFCGPVEKVAPLEYDLYPVGMPSVDYPDALEAANAQIHVSRTPLFTAGKW